MCHRSPGDHGVRYKALTRHRLLCASRYGGSAQGEAAGVWNCVEPPCKAGVGVSEARHAAAADARPRLKFYLGVSKETQLHAVRHDERLR
jgi:hypothetical protein